MLFTWHHRNKKQSKLLCGKHFRITENWELRWCNKSIFSRCFPTKAQWKIAQDSVMKIVLGNRWKVESLLISLLLNWASKHLRCFLLILQVELEASGVTNLHRPGCCESLKLYQMQIKVKVLNLTELLVTTRKEFAARFLCECIVDSIRFWLANFSHLNFPGADEKL